MANVQPIAVTERTAAKMMELRADQFRVWVQAVDLEPCDLAGEPRYLVSDLERRARGDSEDPGDSW